MEPLRLGFGSIEVDDGLELWARNGSMVFAARKSIMFLLPLLISRFSSPVLQHTTPFCRFLLYTNQEKFQL